MDQQFITDLFSLKGHTALVTGSSRGIGRSIAMLLGHAGASVIFHASKPSQRLEATVEEARRAGIDCNEFTADLANEKDVAELAAACLPMQPDILILNASAQTYMTVEAFDSQEFDREFSANVKAGYLLIKALLPSMEQKKWGRIISIGSVNQWKQAPRLTVYAATKCAQESMILSLARSPHAANGVTFNNVAPGVIQTDRNAVVLSNPGTVEILLDLIPARHFGFADDIAGQVLLLASKAGAYINGASIPVTGGMHL